VWYCAHGIFYFKLVDADQDSYLIHENVYLIQAETPASASSKAEAVAKANEDLSIDGHLELNEKKARYLFAGIRKLIEVEAGPVPTGPTCFEGRELTYSVFEVDTFEQVLALVQGEMIEILYRE
jgi:hypothetical protein